MIKFLWAVSLVACARPLPAAYDVNYVDDLTIPMDTASVDGLVQVVNRGTVPLDLSTVTVIDFGLTEARVVKDLPWMFLKSGEPKHELLRPEHAAGKLRPETEKRFAEDGIFPRTVDDDALNFTMVFPEHSTWVRTFYGHAELRIGGTDSSILFKIHVAPSGTPINMHSAVSVQARF